MIFEAPQARNKDIDDYKDLPEDKVKRQDGLPTKDDLVKLMGMKDEKEGMAGNPTIQLIVKICS